MKYLNLGCGNRFHPDWINIDFVSKSKEVIRYNLLKGIPFPESSFDVIYHSHVLEHFYKNQASFFLTECWRVLKPGGVLRVVVPDLEKIAKDYLLALEKAENASQDLDFYYDWILIEMYDQVVRNESGGEMKYILTQDILPNQKYIIDRCGLEIEELIKLGKKMQAESKTRKRLKQIYRFLRDWANPRELLLKALLWREYKALQIGRFRQSGEIHQWMYDSYSLKRLLSNCDYKDVVKRTARSSYIQNWSSFNLDTEPDGTIYKPDSLFMEGIK